MSEQDPPRREVRWVQSDDRHAYEQLLRLLFDPPKRQDRSHQSRPARHTYRPPESSTTSTPGGSPLTILLDSPSLGPPMNLTVTPTPIVSRLWQVAGAWDQ